MMSFCPFDRFKLKNLVMAETIGYCFSENTLVAKDKAIDIMYILYTY